MALFENLFSTPTQPVLPKVPQKKTGGLFSGLFEESVPTPAVPQKKDVFKIASTPSDTLLTPSPAGFKPVSAQPETRPTEKPGLFANLFAPISKTKAFQAGAQVVKESIEDVKTRIGEFRELEDIEKFPEEKHAKARALARLAKVGLGGVNLAFTPVTAGIKAAEEIPIAKFPAKATSFVFEKLGEAGARGAEFALNRLPVSEEIKNVFRPVVMEAGALAVQIKGARVAFRPVETVSKKISTKIAERQKAGVKMTPEEAQKIKTEVVKESPELRSQKPQDVEIKTRMGEEVKIETNQKALLENLLRNEEKVNFKRVKSLGKDLEGRGVGARFEYDYKTGEATIYTTSKTTASNLAHEIGHFFDHKLSGKIGERLTDLVPDYTRNKAQIDASLTRFAVEKLGGEATSKQIIETVNKFIADFKTDVERLAKVRGETRGGFNEQFASAVASVIRNPQMAKLRAPQFSNFIEIMLKNTGVLETRIKNIAEQGKTQVITPQPIEGAKAELRAEGRIVLEPRDVLPKRGKIGAEKAEEVSGAEPAEIVQPGGKQVAETGAKKAEISERGLKPKKIRNESKLHELDTEIVNLEQAIRGNPASELSKYAVKGKLPEVTGRGKSEYARTGDQIIAELGFKDTELAARIFEKLQIAKKHLRELKSERREVKGETFEEFTEAQIEKINNILQDAANSVNESSGLFAGTGLKTGKFVEGRKAYNPEKINAPEDVEALFKGVAEAGGEFRKQRISKADEDIKALAQEVGVSVQDLMNTQPGSIANAETVFRARQLVSDLAQDLRDTIRKVTTETASQAELQEVKTKLFRLQGSMKSIAGFRTEASNIFRQFKLEARAGENDIMTDLVSVLKKIDKEAGDDLGSFLKKSKDLMEPTFGDKAWHLWYMSILSGGSTQIKNIGGNFSQMVGEVAVQAVTDPRGFRVAMAGLTKGMTEGFGEFKRIMREGETSKFEERGIKPIRFTLGAEKETRPFIKATKVSVATMLNAFDYVGRFMAGMDAWARMGFKGMEIRAAARERAVAEGLKGEKVEQRIQELTDKPLEEMIEQADQFAKRGTYTQRPTGVLGLLVEGINRMTSLSAKDKLEAVETFKALKEKRFEEVKVGALGKAAIKGVARTIVPFSRVVANVVNNSIDWTPVGFLREGLPARGLQAVFGAKKSLSRPQRQQLGRAVIGTMGMIYAASLALEDRLSGNGPSNAGKRQQFKDSGWRQNSIRFGDRWYPYQNWGPPSVGLTIVGNYFDSVKYGNLDEDELNERLVAVVMGSVNSILDMSFLSGLSDLVTAVENYDRGGERYAKRYIAQQITSPFPNLVKQTARYFDPTQFETDSVGEYIRSNLRLTGGLRPRLNVFGEPIKGERLTELEPVKVTKDPVIKFLAENELWVSVPSKATKIRKAGEIESRVMTEDEYYNYVKISGQLIKQRLTRDLDIIRSFSADKQQDRIDDIVRDVREETKRKIQFGIGL